MLYLIPIAISERPLGEVLPLAHYASTVTPLRLFFVENIRTARRALRRLAPALPIDECEFVEIEKRRDEAIVAKALERLQKGENAGLMSEAGCPGVADPGAHIVLAAHQRGVRVIPLVGPSSILLALMASGQNGQRFAFLGYLPRETAELKRELILLEKRALKEREAQIFIETPYRNQRLVETLLATLGTHTLLTIAQDITGDGERIETRTIAEWRKHKPTMEKQPSIYIIGVKN